jgi:hypothetical protein
LRSAFSDFLLTDTAVDVDEISSLVRPDLKFLLTSLNPPSITLFTIDAISS